MKRKAYRLSCLSSNSIQIDPNESEGHAKLRRVAAKHAAPLVELHSIMKTNENNGFLWWDNAHATSYGQEVIAESILKVLLPEIKKLPR